MSIGVPGDGFTAAVIVVFSAGEMMSVFRAVWDIFAKSVL